MATRLTAMVALLGSLCGAGYAGDIPLVGLVEISDIGQPTLSPDGARVAFRVERASVERNTYDTHWYVQRLDAQAPALRVSDGGVLLRDSAGISLVAEAQWSPDGRWIYYRALVDGRVDVWRAATDGSGAEAVTQDPADVREFILADAGDVLDYSVGGTRERVVAAELDEYHRGIRIDETAATSQGLFRSGYIEGRLATQKLGFWFNRVPVLADAPDRWKRISLRSGELRSREPRPILEAEIKRGALDPSVLQLGEVEPWKLLQEPRGERIAMLTRVGDDAGLRRKPYSELSMLAGRSERRPVKCVAEACVDKAITGILWRPGTDEVVFTVTDPAEGFAQSVFRWNVETGAVWPVVRARGLLAGGRDEQSACALSASALACVASEIDMPPRLERVDLDTGERHVLFEPNAALANDVMRLVVPRLIDWQGADGERFTGQLFSASNAEGAPPPLFITYYRCPGFQRGGFGDQWPLAAMAMRGISALCINAAAYRTSAVERYGQGLSAVRGVVDMLSERGEIDRGRIGMGGLSFGTEVTMWTAIHSDVLTAASVTSPLLSRTMYLHGSLRGDAFFSGLRGSWQSGAPDETPEQWQALAPELNLDRIDAPVLMQMPEQEYLWALDYAIPLQRAGKADVYAFPHEPHILFQPRHKLAANERNLDWFRFWLLGVEDDESGKAPQYAVWREMRERRCAQTTPAAAPWYCHEAQ